MKQKILSFGPVRRSSPSRAKAAASGRRRRRRRTGRQTLNYPPAPADDQVSHRGIHRAERGCLGDLQHQLCREHPLEMHLFNVGELFNQALRRRTASRC